MSEQSPNVKSDPEEMEKMHAVNGNASVIGINGPPASNHIIDDPTLLSALLGNDNEDMDIEEQIYPSEDDEIIRKIDVYISPELAQSMHLVQFPLQTASHSVNPLFMKNGNAKKNIRPPAPPIPTSAKIKTQHNMLELTYTIPKSSFSTQRQVPEVLNLSERKFSSQNIPIKTHMAMGIFDSTGSRIDLIPLKNIMQMRPTFRHVDALFDDETGEEEQQKLNEDKDDKASKPIMFKKPENERAVLARRNSYAFKKANEEGEEWADLEVFGPGSDERKAIIKKAYCPRDSREKTLRFMKSGKTGGNDGYVRSLNYLPSAIVDDAIEDFVAGMEVAVSIDGEEGGQPEWMKDLVKKVTTMFQGRQGVPISFPVIRSRFHSSISDHALVQALSATASLVRGNFVLKSSLMSLSVPVSNARDTILLLMIKYGYVRREYLIQAYANAGEESALVTADVINALLKLMARETLNGMEMKLDDDMTFETEFTAFSRLHEIYWEKREKELVRYIDLYNNAAGI